MHDDIIRLIAEGESETLEFKKSFGKEAVIAISALANSLGGWVLFGVDDRGEFTEGAKGAKNIFNVFIKHRHQNL